MKHSIFLLRGKDNKFEHKLYSYMTSPYSPNFSFPGASLSCQLKAPIWAASRLFSAGLDFGMLLQKTVCYFFFIFLSFNVTEDPNLLRKIKTWHLRDWALKLSRKG